MFVVLKWDALKLKAIKKQHLTLLFYCFQGVVEIFGVSEG
tara:strand:- start:337 stop:456 length:120 start_codon:yes stop_codon:yes gene_type:complete